MFKNFWCLSMFPYPSGNIHIGHIKNYLINNIHNYFINLNLIKVKFNMGWDSFGTPAENISIKKGIPPIVLIKKNIFYIKNKLIYFNFYIKWKREIFTYKKNFYILNQKLISFLLKNNLIYIDNKIINWDDIEKSVLSNEQSNLNKGWRSNSIIKKINILTYYINFLNLKKEILLELNNLNWSYKIKLMQKNWLISEFYWNLNFYNINNKIYILLVKFNLNLKSININFKKFYKIYNYTFFKIKYINTSIVLVNSNYKFKELFLTKKNFNFFLKKKKIYKKKYNNFNKFYFWELCDWGISRQRYWGSPINTNLCFFCKKKFINNFIELPINLNSYKNKNILKNNFFFIKSKCKFCNNISIKENETLDTFFDSSWYYIFFLKKKLLNLWSPINIYIGGIEHSILHLLYSRFILKIFINNKIININLFFHKLINQGLINNNIYYLFYNNIKILINFNYLKKKKKNVFIVYNYINYFIFIKENEKISKSKNNNINLKNYIKNFGKESINLSVLSYKSIYEDTLWNKNNIFKIYNFLIFFLKKNFKKNIKKNIYKFNFINKNLKIFIFFLNLNFFYIIKLFKIFNYNLLINLIINIFNNYNINFYNFIIYKDILIKLLKLLYPFVPYLIYKILFFLKLKKYKIFLYKILNKIKINKNIQFFLFHKNIKKINLILIKFYFLKIKSLNYLYFLSINFKNLIITKNILNIL